MGIRHRLIAGLTLGLTLVGLVGCSSSGGGPAGSSPSVASTSTAGTSAAGTVFDPSQVHEFGIEVDQAALTSMLQNFVSTGDKDWLSATVTIDGTVFENAGIKLKGNSSLRGVTADSAPQDLPWRIRLDKYASGANLDGFSDFTVRANSTQTSLNEAVALDLLRSSGLASEDAIESTFSVNGSDSVLRLVVQNLDERWVTDNFPDAGSDSVLYKSESDGNWNWLGADGDYSDSFDIEAGADDFEPLIRLLDLINNGSSDQIAAELPDLLDLNSFATYLAFEDLVDNSDDIDGPGNNSYLFWDSTTQKFTVVAWDHNLAFGAMMGPGGGQDGMPSPMPGGAGPDGMPAGMPSGMPTGMPPAGDQGSQAGWPGGQFGSEMPSGFPGDMPRGGNGPGGMPGGNGMNKDNPLVAAFEANSDWAALKDQAADDLRAGLIDSGELTSSVDRWVSVVTNSGLVDEATISSEADAIRAYAS